ncbi:outer membrane beta-barrel protein [uncultured Draconibacterium sp.]|uniref:outer membrane beta-barrel protein n=1 Tax=uncultured Draconibacterium sp. TaxID=1573823 RepID=UPI0025D73685|nr:outer membrane beta-barrel protein [uncultured Draconibacterium sp.]
MKTLLKTLVFSVLFFVAAQSQAQISVGGGLWYGSDINSIGISVNGKYDFNEKWAAAPAFTYFLEKDYVKWSALDLDANYNITELENIGSLYAIGGLGITFWSVDFDGGTIDMGEFGSYDLGVDASGSDVGVNLGVGLNIAASEKFAIAPEIKYTISDGSYLRIGAKILFGL